MFYLDCSNRLHNIVSCIHCVQLYGMFEAKVNTASNSKLNLRMKATKSTHVERNKRSFLFHCQQFMCSIVTLIFLSIYLSLYAIQIVYKREGRALCARIKISQTFFFRCQACLSELHFLQPKLSRLPCKQMPYYTKDVILFCALTINLETSYIKTAKML